ncbi:MAG: helix-turn-helix domain-containing protein [Clostridia bacterium]|nr:helix-turn-helix domain-containing protein [Clostridia bacterium]
MKDKEFNPCVRYVNKVTYKVPYETFVCAFDFRLFYGISGTFSVVLQERCETLDAGDFMTVPPGTPYKIECGAEECAYYIVNFDFDASAMDMPVRPPVPEGDFSVQDITSTACRKAFELPCVIRHAEETETFMDALFELYQTPNSPLGSGIMKCILAKAEQIKELSVLAPEKERLIGKVKRFIEQNFKNDISNEQIASVTGYHSYYLNALFLKHEGVTLHKYLNGVRIRKAKEMLLHSEKSVLEVANDCGFQDSAYFSRYFAKTTGVAPKEYRKLSK